MKSLSSSVEQVAVALSPSPEVARKMMRALQVKDLWKEVVMKVYGTGAHYILDSTNAVYILHEDAAKVLIVYSSDSMARDSLCNMQEFLKHDIQQRGECIDEFRILPSRHTMRQRHPYNQEMLPEIQELDEGKRKRALYATKLSPRQKESIARTSSTIDDPRLKASFIDAMETSLKVQNLNS